MGGILHHHFHPFHHHCDHHPHYHHNYHYHHLHVTFSTTFGSAGCKRYLWGLGFDSTLGILKEYGSFGEIKLNENIQQENIATQIIPDDDEALVEAPGAKGSSRGWGLILL